MSHGQSRSGQVTTMNRLSRNTALENVGLITPLPLGSSCRSVLSGGASPCGLWAICIVFHEPCGGVVAGATGAPFNSAMKPIGVRTEPP